MLEALAYFEASVRLEERVPSCSRRWRYASYYGYCLAATLGKTKQGLSLCRKAAESEFFEPDIVLNLAKVQLLAGDRKEAWVSLARAVKLDPDHPEIRAEIRKMGIRRRPVFPFLDRSHPVNVLAGKLAAGGAAAPQAAQRKP
jgi:hypothetical protein